MTKQLVVTGLEQMTDGKTIKVSLRNESSTGYTDMAFWYLPNNEALTIKLGDSWMIDSFPVPDRIAQIMEAANA